jgi:hypothetical protein
VWHDSAVARKHLVAGYDRRRLGPAITMEYLLDMLTAHHVEIDLRGAMSRRRLLGRTRPKDWNQTVQAARPTDPP